MAKKGANGKTSRKKGSGKSKKGAVNSNSGKMSFGRNFRMTPEVKKLGDDRKLDRLVVKWIIDKKRI